MKSIYNKLWTLIFIALFLFGCKKEETFVKNNETIIELNGNCIHFDVGIKTRGQLNHNNVLNDDFAVLGYQYPTIWENEKAMTRPNVFFTDQDHNNICLPQKVEYFVNSNAGTEYFSYSPEQAWTGNTYAFFAYHPYYEDSDKNDENLPPVVIFDDNNTVVVGDPYITYTLPSLNDPTSLIDLMTASFTDTNFSESRNGVILNMQHRLSAIDIGIRNYAKYAVGVDAQGNPIEKNVIIEVLGCDIELNDIAQKSRIYFDPDIKDNKPTTADAHFTFVDSKKTEGDGDWILNALDIPYNITDITRITKDTESENHTTKATTLLLIPQVGFLEGEINLRYKRKYTDDNGTVIYIPNPEPVNSDHDLYVASNLNINFNRELIGGYRYDIEIVFTSNAITTQSRADDQWISKDVIHKFE